MIVMPSETAGLMATVSARKYSKADRYSVVHAAAEVSKAAVAHNERGENDPREFGPWNQAVYGVWMLVEAM